MDRQLQELMNESHALEDSSRKKEESRIEKDNEKII